jgi:hypothetical protein
MAIFSISVELGNLVPSGASFSARAFPTLAYAVQRIAQLAHANWVAYAHGAPLPDGSVIQNRTGEYVRSILLRQTGDLSAEVYSDLAYAHVIEEGAPQRDLHTMLNSSLKVRVTKSGKRYLIIPFRWNAPGSVMGHQMPQQVWDWWSGKGASHIVNGDMAYKRLSGTGAYDVKSRARITVAAWRYHWGDRLTKDALEGMGITGRAAQRMHGMVNFRNPAGSGGSSHSKFLTFRTMVEGSKGWRVPAQRGKWPARTVADQIRPVAEEAFAAAMQEDIERYLQTILGGAGG